MSGANQSNRNMDGGSTKETSYNGNFIGPSSRPGCSSGSGVAATTHAQCPAPQNGLKMVDALHDARFGETITSYRRVQAPRWSATAAAARATAARGT